MRTSKLIPVGILTGALAFLTSCGSDPPPPPVIEQHDVTIVQPKPKPKPKPVKREKAPEEFRAVTTPN